LYYEGKPAVSGEDVVIMKSIDEIYTKYPFYGRPRITQTLQRDYGYTINHKHVYRLMQVMGIEAVFPKPNLSKPNIQSMIYPYLLEGVLIAKPNQVWSVDITYIRMRGGFAYLVAILDWYSRYIVSWELSDSLHVWFCCEALKSALSKGMPDIHNSDQGSHFTSQAYTDILKGYPGIQISMDHKGRCFDNIFVERLWRTIKYEEVYLKEYDSLKYARQSLHEYIEFYNTKRYHQALDYKTPEAIYFQKPVLTI